ncbi:MAG: IS3 family transposase, partial [Acutalibacter sp.]|nr:IS3 family transposase [Acutalibacter sp.]
DNAVAENFFSCLKCELIHLAHYSTRVKAQADVFAYIETFYNTVRPHSALGWISPDSFEENLISSADHLPLSCTQIEPESVGRKRNFFGSCAPSDLSRKRLRLRWGEGAVCRRITFSLCPICGQGCGSRPHLPKWAVWAERPKPYH